MKARYAPAAGLAVITITADMMLVFAHTRSMGLLLIAAVGPPLTALLLGWAAAGGVGRIGKMVAGVAIGATAVPILVTLTGGLFAVVAWGLVEPLAAAFQLVRQVRFERGQKVVVLGDGTLGQLIARVVHRICPSLVLVGKHSEKLELAEKVHIQTAEVGDFVPRQDADVVVDATGAASGLALACRAVRPRGTIVLKSTYAGDEPVDLSSLVINEVTLIGSRCGPFADALNALARHEVDVTNLVSRHMSVENAIEALELAARSDVVKVILDVACGR